MLDDYSLQAVRGLEDGLARAGALVMRSFKGLPAPHLLRRFRGAAVVGGPDRTGLLARLERATATVPAPVIAILPEGVAPEPAPRGPGVVDLIPARSRDIARRVLLMAQVPIVGAQRGDATRASPGPRQGRKPKSDDAAGAEGRTGVVAVASSTGGVSVLAAMLRELPPAGGAVVVAQHMEAEFVPSFAAWLMADSGWRVVVVEVRLRSRRVPRTSRPVDATSSWTTWSCVRGRRPAGSCQAPTACSRASPRSARA